MNKLDKWTTKNKNNFVGILAFLVLGWLVNSSLDWLSRQLSKNTDGLLTAITSTLKFKIDLPGISIFGLLLSAVIFVILIHIYNVWIIRGRKLVILKALYGEDGRFVDITNELNSRVYTDRLKTVIDNGIAGDPTPGVRKSAKINYKFKGRAKQITVKEGEVVDIKD